MIGEYISKVRTEYPQTIRQIGGLVAMDLTAIAVGSAAFSGEVNKKALMAMGLGIGMAYWVKLDQGFSSVFDKIDQTDRGVQKYFCEQPYPSRGTRVPINFSELVVRSGVVMINALATSSAVMLGELVAERQPIIMGAFAAAGMGAMNTLSAMSVRAVEGYKQRGDEYLARILYGGVKG